MGTYFVWNEHSVINLTEDPARERGGRGLGRTGFGASLLAVDAGLTSDMVKRC